MYVVMYTFPQRTAVYWAVDDGRKGSDPVEIAGTSVAEADVARTRCVIKRRFRREARQRGVGYVFEDLDAAADYVETKKAGGVAHRAPRSDAARSKYEDWEIEEAHNARLVAAERRIGC